MTQYQVFEIFISNMTAGTKSSSELENRVQQLLELESKLKGRIIWQDEAVD